VALFTPHLGKDSISDWTTGDFNDDRVTTLDDLHLLQFHLGQSVAPSVAASAVPEPETWLFVLTAGLLWLVAKKGRRAG
jgi:hypothetical protein